jgi:antirestriction protein
MKYKVVIVNEQRETDMTVGGTVYFDSEALARDFIKSHNETNTSRAYMVHMSETYTMTTNG